MHPSGVISTILGLFLATTLFAQEVPWQMMDSLTHLADSLKHPAPKTGAFDSLQLETEAFRRRISDDTPAHMGSLSLSTLNSRLDSLRTIKSPDTLVAKYLIGAKTNTDSLQRLLRLPSQTEQAAKLQQRAKKELAILSAKVNEKLKLFAEQGANTGQLSGFNLPAAGGSNLAGVGTVLPGVAVAYPVPSITAATEGLSLPDATISSSITQTKLSMPDSKSLSVPTLPVVNTSFSEVDEVKGELGKVKGAMGEAQAYKKDITAITSGNLDSVDSKSLEASIASAEGVPQQGSEFSDAVDHAELLKKWNSDPLYQRELAVTAAKEQAVNYFSGHESELLSAMEQLNKAKASAKDAEQTVDMFSKPGNPMKDKPFIERLRPGFNLQLQWSQIVLLDINPYVGCRISGRWTAGVGWNERVGFNSSTYAFSERDRIYGPRAFVHYKFKESNYIILAPELMHATVPVSAASAGESGTSWVPGLMAGYRREFRFSRKLIGTVQFLYNLVPPSGQYASRLNVLMGFEFPLKRKQRSP